MSVLKAADEFLAGVAQVERTIEGLGVSKAELDRYRLQLRDDRVALAWSLLRALQMAQPMILCARKMTTAEDITAVERGPRRR